jgi:hypothetical protein
MRIGDGEAGPVLLVSRRLLPPPGWTGGAAVGRLCCGGSPGSGGYGTGDALRFVLRDAGPVTVTRRPGG